MDREDLTRCRGCGALCDGDVCDAHCAERAKHKEAVAYLHEREWEREGDESGPAEAMMSHDYYCLECLGEDFASRSAQPVSAKDLREYVSNHPFHHAPECYICGEIITVK